jgi:hypothetical protein
VTGRLKCRDLVPQVRHKALENKGVKTGPNLAGSSKEGGGSKRENFYNNDDDPSIYLEGLRNNANTPKQNSRYSGSDSNHVGFEVFTAVILKNTVLWDEAPCGFIINRRFERTCRLHFQGRRNKASEGNC